MYEGSTLTYTGKLTVTTCWCGIQLAIPANLYRRAHDEGVRVYCPVGHQFYFTETELDRQRRRAEQAEARATCEAQRRQAEADLRRDTERRLSAQKGATTRAKRRHAAGLCPVCKRSFKQLRDHIESKHPDYQP